jgi:hypothetical protein
MRLNANQLIRIAQHLNTLWIEEKYRRIYLDCLDPAAKKRPGASDCAKVELMIAQKLATLLPPDVRISLIDLVFQTGGTDPVRFKTKPRIAGSWLAFTSAMQRRDWKKAGQESSVDSGSSTGLNNRNSKRRAFFERAARQYPFHRSLTKKRKLLDLLLSSASL